MRAISKRTFSLILVGVMLAMACMTLLPTTAFAAAIEEEHEHTSECTHDSQPISPRALCSWVQQSVSYGSTFIATSTCTQCRVKKGYECRIETRNFKCRIHPNETKTEKQRAYVCYSCENHWYTAI